MDVVRTNVEKIGGKVEIDSRVGKGTTLRLRIPLTLAIIPALIVRSVHQSFALPQGALSELVHITPEQSATTIYADWRVASADLTRELRLRPGAVVVPAEPPHLQVTLLSPREPLCAVRFLSAADLESPQPPRRPEMR